MKPKPVSRAPETDYPSFHRFHVSRQAMATGAAVVATATILSGCAPKQPGGEMVCPQPPETEYPEFRGDIAAPVPPETNQTSSIESPPNIPGKMPAVERPEEPVLLGLIAAPTRPDASSDQ